MNYLTEEEREATIEMSFEDAMEFWSSQEVSDLFFVMFPNAFDMFKMPINRILDSFEHCVMNEKGFPAHVFVVEESRLEEGEEGVAFIEPKRSFIGTLISAMGLLEDALMFEQLTPNREIFLSKFLLLIKNWANLIASFSTEEKIQEIESFYKENQKEQELTDETLSHVISTLESAMLDLDKRLQRAENILYGKFAFRDLMYLLAEMRREVSKLKAYKPAVFSVSEMYLNSLDSYFSKKAPGQKYSFKDFRKSNSDPTLRSPRDAAREKGEDPDIDGFKGSQRIKEHPDCT